MAAGQPSLVLSTAPEGMVEDAQQPIRGMDAHPSVLAELAHDPALVETAYGNPVQLPARQVCQLPEFVAELPRRAGCGKLVDMAGEQHKAQKAHPDAIHQGLAWGQKRRLSRRLVT